MLTTKTSKVPLGFVQMGLKEGTRVLHKTLEEDSDR